MFVSMCQITKEKYLNFRNVRKITTVLLMGLHTKSLYCVRKEMKLTWFYLVKYVNQIKIAYQIYVKMEPVLVKEKVNRAKIMKIVMLVIFVIQLNYANNNNILMM